MKRILPLCLCLLLLMGCVPLPRPWARLAPTAVPPSIQDVSEATQAPAITDPPPAAVPGTADAAPANESSPAVSGFTPAPSPSPAPRKTALPLQTYAGKYLRFQVPGDWLRAEVPDGVFFYPDPNDTGHTCLSCQEVPNDMKLTETMVDIALLFSSEEAITALVEGALTSSGMTGFSLSPVAVKKARLNGVSCYEGASDITLNGELYAFAGHIFLRGDRLILLIWVGDQARYAEGLKTVYASLQAVQ